MEASGVRGRDSCLIENVSDSRSLEVGLKGKLSFQCLAAFEFVERVDGIVYRIEYYRFKWKLSSV